MTEQTTRIRPLLVVAAAFASSLAVGLLVVLWLLGGLARRPRRRPRSAGHSNLTDQSGQTVTEKNLLGHPTLILASALPIAPT